MNDDIIDLKKALEQVPDKDKVVNAIIGEAKPRMGNPSRHERRMTYFRERFALQLKSIVDEMMVEHAAEKYEERFFDYKHYEEHLTKNSLYLKISQSWLYLRKYLDPDGIYTKFAQFIEIRRSKEGIRIQYQKDIIEPEAADLVATKVLSIDEQQQLLRDKIDEWLEKSIKGEELTLTKLQLTQEQITQIDASLCQLDNIIYKIFTDRIWIAKTE